MYISCFRIVHNDQILDVSFENFVLHQLATNNDDSSQVNL
jgi:hypothetical protein